MLDPVVIVAAKRTPIGHFNGVFKDISTPQLGGYAIRAVASILPPSEKIDEVIMGCVLSAGLGQAPARQAAHYANLPVSIPSVTINKMCGSGMKSVMMAFHEIQSNNADIIIAGGMENMSRAPYLMPGARFGYRIGAQTVDDHMMLDGLTNAYDDHLSMGVIADQSAAALHISREAQDDYAISSCERARTATQQKSFASEIIPVSIETKNGEVLIEADEGISKINTDKIKTLKPCFVKNGTITPANASSISDGAAALLLMRLSHAEKLGLIPFAKIIGDFTVAKASEEFPTAPIFAIEGLLQKIQWTAESVDLFEINEAFAMVVIAAMKALSIPHDKVNIWGGACVLGHPIGASGARILVTLIHALKKQGKKRGVAAICIGGGESTAMAIEIM